MAKIIKTYVTPGRGVLIEIQRTAYKLTFGASTVLIPKIIPLRIYPYQPDRTILTPDEEGSISLELPNFYVKIISSFIKTLEEHGNGNIHTKPKQTNSGLPEDGSIDNSN